MTTKRTKEEIEKFIVEVIHEERWDWYIYFDSHCEEKPYIFEDDGTMFYCLGHCRIGYYFGDGNVTKKNKALFNKIAPETMNELNDQFLGITDF